MHKVYLKRGDSFNAISYQGKTFIHTADASALAEPGNLTYDYNSGSEGAQDSPVSFTDSEGNTTGGVVDGCIAAIDQSISVGPEIIRGSNGRIYYNQKS